MRRPKSRPTGSHHYNGFATASLAPIQHVAGENPGVPGCDPIGPLAVNPNGVQVFSLSEPAACKLRAAAHRFQACYTIFRRRMRRK